MTMQVMCAWCGATLPAKPGEGISHGICQACATKLLQELGDAPDSKPEANMATFRAVFDNSMEGIAGTWRPVRDDGEPVILDETVDLEESDAKYTVVTFETLNDPTSVHEMEYALDSNEEVAEWAILPGGRHVMATYQISDQPPRQTNGAAYQAGENVVVFFDPYRDAYGYCFQGVDANGNAFERNDAERFNAFQDALDAAGI